MDTDFLDDGYTQKGYIAANKQGLYGELEFTYRPALLKTVNRISELIQRDPPHWDNFADAAAKAMGREPGLLKSWSLKDRNGNPVPITEANLLRIRNPLFQRLWSIIAGHSTSDQRPDGSPVETPNPEADAKNSPAG